MSSTPNITVHVRYRVLNEEAFAAYRVRAAGTIIAAGGVPLPGATAVQSLVGDAAPYKFARLGFDTVEACQNWFRSPEYQDLADLRCSAMDATFDIVEEDQ